MGILFIYIHLISSYPHKESHQNIAIGIWAGKETLSTRVMNQAKSWMRFWESVHVFTDDISPGECDALNEAANPCKVECINLGNLAEHLEGTEWRHRWYFAQPRFLPAMASLYEHSINSSWYLFGDDDTYFFRPAIEKKTKEFSSDKKIVIGKFWSSWERVTQDVPPLRDQHPFAQGGAGVCISHEMMHTIGPHLRNCSIYFNDPDFAGSMRFAMCAERIVGQHEWSLDGAIRSWFTGFHSSSPYFEIADKTLTEAPASFHRILSDEMFVPLYTAHILETPTRSYDLGSLAFTKQSISLGTEQNRFEWRFGFWIGTQDARKPLLNATGRWIPKFASTKKEEVDDDGMEKLIGFSQEYQNGVRIHCECDDRVPVGSAYFSHFADEIGSEPVMIVPCSSFTYVEHTK